MLTPPVAFLDMLGGSELAVIFLLVLVFFGGEKMPEFARGLGKAIREFRKAASGVEQEFKRALEDDPNQSKAPSAFSPPPTPTILPPAAARPTVAPTAVPDHSATPNTVAPSPPSSPASDHPDATDEPHVG